MRTFKEYLEEVRGSISIGKRSVPGGRRFVTVKLPKHTNTEAIPVKNQKEPDQMAGTNKEIKKVL